VPERIVYVYRLVIQYPEGSDRPGWKPACWGALLKSIKDRGRRRAVRERGFRWPRERLFLSADGAYSRMGLLMQFGAQVQVQRSEPVIWWEEVDAMDWWPCTAGHAESGPQYTDKPFGVPGATSPGFFPDELHLFTSGITGASGIDIFGEQER
jgi:hypothetical protein